MRKLIASGLFFVLGASAAFAANDHDMHIRNQDTGYQVVALSELTKDMTEDFFVGKASQFVLECSEGSVLPFKLSLKGEFLALETEDIYTKIKVLKTCFIKCVEDTFLFSIDLQNWNDFQEFFTGMVGVSLNVEEGTPTAGFNIELNQKS